MKKTEPTRRRQHGTQVTNTGGDPLVKLTSLRSIVEHKGYSKIDGVTVDLFSASAILRVYDNISEENQAKYLGMSLPKMASVAFKLLK